jgi:uncharacterized membrane protein YdbT with pleckstrin-like domain
MSLPQQITSIERPVPALLPYYLISSFAAGPAFPILMLLGYFRYQTLRYSFDEEGISMKWGILHRQEINLTYARIQDIHLTSNVVERWLGLAKVQIQTASGSAQAEMTIEGVENFQEVRDFLYSRMRGAATESGPDSSTSQVTTRSNSDELAELLRETASELRAIRRSLEGRLQHDDRSEK